MKCYACNYEYEEDYSNGKYIITKGEKYKEFICSDMKISFERCNRINVRTIYICPNCGTLKVDF